MSIDLTNLSKLDINRDKIIDGSEVKEAIKVTNFSREVRAAINNLHPTSGISKIDRLNLDFLAAIHFDMIKDISKQEFLGLLTDADFTGDANQAVYTAIKDSLLAKMQPDIDLTEAINALKGATAINKQDDKPIQTTDFTAPVMTADGKKVKFLATAIATLNDISGVKQMPLPLPSTAEVSTALANWGISGFEDYVNSLNSDAEQEAKALNFAAALLSMEGSEKPAVVSEFSAINFEVLFKSFQSSKRDVHDFLDNISITNSAKEAYKKHDGYPFADADNAIYQDVAETTGGKVIIYGDSSIIVTEGWSYALDVLVGLDQEKLFNDVMTGSLAHFPTVDGLKFIFSWNKEDATTTSASDSDIWIAYALQKAADKWGHAGNISYDNTTYTYEELAFQIEQEFLDHEVVTLEAGDKKLAIPCAGVQGVKATDGKVKSPFVKYDDNNGKVYIKHNMSYFVSAYKSDNYGNQETFDTINQTLHEMNKAILEKHGVSDWCVVEIDTATGEIAVLEKEALAAHFPGSPNHLLEPTIEWPRYIINLARLYNDTDNQTLKENAKAELDLIVQKHGVDLKGTGQGKRALTHFGFSSSRSLTTEQASLLRTLASTSLKDLGYTADPASIKKRSKGSDVQEAKRVIAYYSLKALQGDKDATAKMTSIKAAMSISNSDSVDISKVNKGNAAAIINSVDSGNAKRSTADLYNSELLFYGFRNEIVVSAATLMELITNKELPEDQRFELLTEVLGRDNGYGNRWYDGTKNTFGMFLCAMIEDTILAMDGADTVLEAPYEPVEAPVAGAKEMNFFADKGNVWGGGSTGNYVIENNTVSFNGVEVDGTDDGNCAGINWSLRGFDRNLLSPVDIYVKVTANSAASDLPRSFKIEAKNGDDILSNVEYDPSVNEFGYVSTPSADGYVKLTVPAGTSVDGLQIVFDAGEKVDDVSFHFFSVDLSEAVPISLPAVGNIIPNNADELSVSAGDNNDIVVNGLATTYSWPSVNLNLGNVAVGTAKYLKVELDITGTANAAANEYGDMMKFIFSDWGNVPSVKDQAGNVLNEWGSVKFSSLSNGKLTCFVEIPENTTNITNLHLQFAPIDGLSCTMNENSFSLVNDLPQ